VRGAAASALLPVQEGTVMGDGECPGCSSAGVHVVDVTDLAIPLCAFSVATLGFYVCVGCGHAEL
jgi:hypothetical protein